MIKIDQKTMDAIAAYMDDDKREQVHFQFAPCEPEEFLFQYLQLDPEFENLLRDEFSIEID